MYLRSQFCISIRVRSGRVSVYLELPAPVGYPVIITFEPQGIPESALFNPLERKEDLDV